MESEQSRHAAPSPTGRRKLWLILGAAVVIVALAVTIPLLLIGGGHSTSYRFGYEAGQYVVANRDSDHPISSPAAVTSTCGKELDDEPHFPGSAISDSKERIAVSDIDRADFINGCRAGVLDATGLK